MKILIKDVVTDILFEEKEKEKEKEKPKDSKPKKKKLKPGIEASTGSGRFSAGVNEAGALAKEDPKTLMKNLNISSAIGQNDIEKIKNLLKQAFMGADAMKTVYTSLVQVNKGDKIGLKIEFSEIKIRDAVKYLYHTLVGARNANILKLESLIQIENSSGSIFVYVGEKRSW